MRAEPLNINNEALLIEDTFMNTYMHDNGIDLGRRNLFKAAIAGLVLGLLPGTAFAAASGNPKTLVVYYSRTGNTRAVAKEIHKQLGGDIVELETVQPYPEAYRATTEQAKRELESGFKPPLKTKIENMDSYDVIVVGSPCWWGTVATPMITFLTEYDLSGKTIAPFMTHEGSGLGRTVTHIRQLCPKATVVEGLAIRGSNADEAQKPVASWLGKIGLK